MTKCDRKEANPAHFCDENQHEVAALYHYVMRPGKKDPTVLSEKIFAAAEYLKFRADLDPLYKQSFLTVLEAVRVHRKTFGEIPDPAIGHAVTDCLKTYEHVRNWVLSDNQIDGPDMEFPACTSWDQFARMSRSDRLRLQSALGRKNYRDMCEIYGYLLQSIPTHARMIFNAGDGTPLEHSFLSQMFPLLEKRQETVHVVSVDIRPAIFDLQAEAANEYRGSNVTMSFHCMDGRRTIFAEDVFDCTVASFMIDDCNDQLSLFRELGRVTKREGVICISGHHLDEENPADDLVHNFADLHHISGHPATFASACDFARTASLHVVTQRRNPHAWGLVLSTCE